MTKSLVLFIVSINLFIGSFSALSKAEEFQCAGGPEACAEGGEIYYLERQTGESCSGGYEACKAYLQSQLLDKKIEKELTLSDGSLNKSGGNKNIYCINLDSKLKCLRFQKGNPNKSVWIDPRNPPNGVYCYVSEDGEKATCID